MRRLAGWVGVCLVAGVGRGNNGSGGGKAAAPGERAGQYGWGCCCRWRADRIVRLSGCSLRHHGACLSPLSLRHFHLTSADLDHHNPQLRESLTDWLRWLHTEFGFEGWRFDFVRGYAPEYCKE